METALMLIYCENVPCRSSLQRYCSTPGDGADTLPINVVPEGAPISFHNSALRLSPKNIKVLFPRQTINGFFPAAL